VNLTKLFHPSRLAIITMLALHLLSQKAIAALPSVQITQLHVGFPASPLSGAFDANGQPRFLFKPGFFAPISGSVENLDSSDAELILDCPDNDDLQTQLIVIQPKGSGGELSGVIKPGNQSPTIRASIRNIDEASIRVTPFGIEPGKFLILGIGGSIESFRIPKEDGGDPDELEEGSLRGGRVEVGQLTKVSQLPRVWFAYQAVDMAVLLTGSNDEFWKELAKSEFQPQRQALIEWVRRGGRMIISSGAKPELLRAIPDLGDLIGIQLQAANRKPVNLLRLTWTYQRVTKSETMRSETDAPLNRLTMTPRIDRPNRILMQTTEGAGGVEPLIIQNAFGLGRVTIVGWDLDASPFADRNYRSSVWDWLINESGTKLPTGRDRLGDEREDAYMHRLAEVQDTFEEIPVISFGWIALVLFGYILLIGPIDYLILRKFVGKLEWTWLTFPLIVTVSSIAAIQAANRNKGGELKINKIDVVDYDLATRSIVGRSWFSMYSPQIDRYDIELQTNPNWVSRPSDVLLSWQGRTRAGRQSLFRRSYDMDLAGAKLKQVPMQIWSTKGFGAIWSSTFDQAAPPLNSKLSHPPAESDGVAGAIISKLPVTFDAEVTLFYGDRAIRLDSLVPGIERSILKKSTDPGIAQWINQIVKDDLRLRDGTRLPNVMPTSLWPMLFHDRTGLREASINASVRELDQSHRGSDRAKDEAVLIARIPMVEGTLNDMQGSASVPTKINLHQATETKLEGKLRQETYIRIFIPIQPR
jgi:hypothetical protein